jgi:hypothetical protein
MTTETNGRTVDVLDSEALLERVRMIEERPLDTRALAYVQLHESLQSSLEGGDAGHR